MSDRGSVVLDRYECQHIGVGRFEPRCPVCGGTLRRCCDSLVGAVPHRPGCPEIREATVTELPEPLRA